MDHLQRWSRGHKYKKTGDVPLFKMSHEHPGPYHESLRGGGGGEGGNQTGYFLDEWWLCSDSRKKGWEGILMYRKMNNVHKEKYDTVLAREVIYR